MNKQRSLTLLETTLLEALIEARKVLAVAIRAGWDGETTDAEIAEHITIKKIDAAIARATKGQS